jgi:hypothetical protein
MSNLVLLVMDVWNDVEEMACNMVQVAAEITLLLVDNTQRRRQQQRLLRKDGAPLLRLVRTAVFLDLDQLFPNRGWD